MKTKPTSSRLRAVIQALFIVFLWATSWVFIKIGLQDIPALTFAGLRYMLAFICLLASMVLPAQRASLRSLSPQAWRRLLLLGLLLYAVTQGAMFLSLAYLPAVTVNVMWSFSSIMVALMGIAFLSERPTGFQWWGVGIATLGVVFYFYPVSLPAGQFIGVVAAAVGILGNAGAVIMGRSINRTGQIPALIVTVVSMGAGALALLTTGILLQGLPPISLQGWAIIAWLAVVNTAFTFTLWNHTLRTLSATESSIINGTMSIWIPVLAVLFLHETLTAKAVFGLIVAGLGTLIVQMRRPLALRLGRQRLPMGEE
jgi:drug/metabolite transporter (DMT)-like permease